MVQSEAEASISAEQAKCNEAERAKAELKSRLSDAAQEISNLKASLHQEQDAAAEQKVLAPNHCFSPFCESYYLPTLATTCQISSCLLSRK